MGFWLEGVLKLLLTDAGSLMYHLVLAFSVAGALALTLNQSAPGESPRFKRALIGLGILLALQLSLFVVSGLAWQGIVSGEKLLPAMDRAVTLLSLVVVIWLWAFPDPAPGVDVAVFLLGVLLVTAGVFSMLWWSNQSVEVAFNGTWLDVASQMMSLVICLMGMAVLAIRRVEGWVYGFWMMAILAAGFALQLAIAQSGSDYPAAVRLAQMTAYPFLLLLAQRTALAQIPVQVSAAAETADRSSLSAAVSSRYADPQLWQALTRLATESEPERVCGGITALLAEIMQADLCLLLLPPDGAGKMVVRCGYNLKEKRQLGSLTLDSRALPMLVSSLRMGRSRRFASGSTSPDLASLARAYQLEHAGNLLFAPVLSPDGKPLISVLLLSPYTDRDWNADEQAFLGVLSRLLVHFLQRSQQMESLKEDLDQARQITRLAQEQAQQAVDERQKLRDRVAVLEEHVQHDQLQLASLAAASAAYEQAQSSITQLQAENEKLSEAFRLATENSARQQQAAEGELRLALEEIVFLKTALADTDQKILALKSVEVDATLPGAQLDVVMAIAQDLRQPLSSIVGYTDFLLSEKSGILVMQQRKQLERIKIATERMNRLVDDLLQAISPESNPLRLKFSDVDAREVIQQAVTEISQFRRERGIALQLDLPEEPLRIRSDRYALANVFAQLLQNASQASPPGGDVKMKVLVESNEGQVDYLLVQVSDSSNGFEAQDLVRVFTPRPADAQEEGNPVDMPRLKALVEALGGRAWVDSEPGHGATISVLLPVSPSVSGGNGRGVAK